MTEPTPKAPKVRITIGGRAALTIEQAAARKGVKPKSITGEIARHGFEHDAMLDGRKKLYLQARFDAWWDNRPGKGANLRRDALSTR